ncbi:squalene/phytoene synthase family protein [Sanguibacter sp. HDW7]|uniref:phytoene/squalene synthase family protein n=1 Tax=Sanguibacter sp. HDW7 TaxID=2714931 RepID=UPI001F0FF65B|nr:squalene/phytoene synthase family protein [Sanguibacter sp. HDW7]
MSASERARYDAAARAASETVIASYSTSFSLAVRLLPPGQRADVRAVYGLVRLADEVVDGALDEVAPDARTRLLDDLEDEVALSLVRGCSTNLVVHAFTLAALRCGIDATLTEPFFAAMRTDLVQGDHDPASLATYVHGSAEVVGLMCLRVFAADLPPADRQRLLHEAAPGACALGSAFQKVNFVRDLGADLDERGRRYLADLATAPTDAARDAALDDVDAEIALARTAVPLLPPGARRAVVAATALFAELSRRLRTTPAHAIASTRVSVPAARKARVVGGALLRDAAARRPRGARGRRVRPVVRQGVA